MNNHSQYNYAAEIIHHAHAIHKYMLDIINWLELNHHPNEELPEPSNNAPSMFDIETYATRSNLITRTNAKLSKPTAKL